MFRLPQAVLMAAALLVATAKAADPIPVADFFRDATVTRAVMSPSGRHAAVVVSPGGGARRRLAVIDVKSLAASKMLASFTDIDIATVRWVNDDWIVFTVSDQQVPGIDQPGSGLYSVDRVGAKAPRQLIRARETLFAEARPGERELSGYRHIFERVLRDGTNDVVVRRFLFDNKGEPTGTALLRVDVTDGRSTNITLGSPANSYEFALDRQGIPRIAMSYAGGKTKLYRKTTAASADWSLLQEFDSFRDDFRTARPIAVGLDNVIYGIGAVDASTDTTSLVRMDIHGADVHVQPLLSLAGFDFEGSLEFGVSGELLGIRYLNDAWSSFWYDPRMKALQQKVDALLPNTVNILDCGACGDLSRVLVRSWSDRQPLVFQLYDSATGKLELMAQSRPWIDPAAMAMRDMQRFTARDGLSIPVHITRPRGVKGPAPAVVLVHGGPWVRGGSWQWDDESQFLASRGYVVIEPEFRGSSGFGSTLFRASFKQWGLKMQDDLVDAAGWAVQQGYVDAKRICIAGASYGGYATLMGLIRDPDVFRCGVDWAGVSDIELMYSIHWSDFSEEWKRYGMPVLIGDLEKDAAQLKATSPLQQAARLTRPLLIAHGGDDRRVPIEHATRFRDAVKANNREVEFTVYPGEGHGWRLEANKVDFWSRVERFLAKNLAPAP